MFKFENKLCPVCRERFREGDDIAVCPVCGAPHHRACYQAANRCALENLHGRFTWNGRLPDEPMPVPDIEVLRSAAVVQSGESGDSSFENNPEDDERVLTLLGLSNLSEEEREEFMQVKDLGAMKDLIGSIRDDSEGEDGVSMQELIAYTGTSVWHYVRAFNSFRGMTPNGKNRYTSFNICSGLFSPVYQFYRKMDLLGVAAMIMSVLPSAVLMLNGGASYTEAASGGLSLLMNLISIVPIVLLCVFGDYLFYRKAIKRIRKIRGRFEGRTKSLEYIKALADSGRPSFVRAALGALAMVFARACLLALIR